MSEEIKPIPIRVQIPIVGVNVLLVEMANVYVVVTQLGIWNSKYMYRTSQIGLHSHSQECPKPDCACDCTSCQSDECKCTCHYEKNIDFHMD